MQQMKKEFYVVKINLNSWFHMYSSWIHHSLHPWKRHCFSYEDPNQNYVEMTKFPRLLKSFLEIGIFLCAIILNHVSFRKCIWLKKLWPFSYNHHWKLSNVMSCHVLQSNMISSSNMLWMVGRFFDILCLNFQTTITLNGKQKNLCMQAQHVMFLVNTKIIQFR
jgi:hypothetical protein